MAIDVVPSDEFIKFDSGQLFAWKLHFVQQELR